MYHHPHPPPQAANTRATTSLGVVAVIMYHCCIGLHVAVSLV